MSLSKTLSKVAAKIITKFGAECVFTHKETATLDPATGIRTTTDTTFEGYGVKDKYTIDEINGTTVLSSDIKLILERTDSEPKVGDTCVINGNEAHRVMNVTPVDPDEYQIIYEVQLRV